jgi:hypothetical protein
MEKEKKIDISTVFVGLCLITEIFEDTTGEKIGLFLGGMFDHEIRLAGFHRENQRLPSSMEELNSDPKASIVLERMKNIFRNLLKNAINAAAREEAQAEVRRQKQAFNEMKNKFNAMHKPAPEGTIRELAAKYNKSIGEICRLKAEGRLHELVES